MKKILFFAATILLASFAYAQYAVGDYYELDGIPSIVVYVDQTGSHGMVMSYPAVCSEKQVNALLKKNGIPRNLADRYLNGDIAYLQIQKKDKNIVKDIKATVYSQMGGNGEENARIIIDYCTTHGITVEQYFEEQAWAEHLGNGWYIPGDNELTYIGRFLLQGTETNISESSMFKHLKAIRDKYINERSFFVPTTPYSSTREPNYRFEHRMMLCYKGVGSDCHLTIHNGDSRFYIKGLLVWGYAYKDKGCMMPFEYQNGEWELGGLIAKKRKLIIYENLLGFRFPQGGQSSNGCLVAVHEF